MILHRVSRPRPRDFRRHRAEPCVILGRMIDRRHRAACALALVLMLAACGSRRRAEELEREAIERQRAVEQEMIRRLAQSVLPPDAAPAADPWTSPRSLPPVDPPGSPPPPPLRAGCLDHAAILSFEAGGSLRACFDANQDGIAERCWRWSPDGAPLLQPGGGAQAEQGDPPPAEAPGFYTDSEHNDSGRITIDGPHVEVCAPDRACVRLHPRVGEDEELVQVSTGTDYRRAALVVRSTDGQSAHLDLWDLERGRMVAALPFRGLARDTTYAFGARIGRGALAALVEHQAQPSGAIAIYGLDGSFRGMVGGTTNGIARALDVGRALQSSGVLLVPEPAIEDQPLVLHAVDLGTGAAAGRFVVQRLPGAAPDIELARAAPGIVTAAQWGKELRLDVIELRARTMRTLRAPAC